jgi:hypothetical protein
MPSEERSVDRLGGVVGIVQTDHLAGLNHDRCIQAV